MDKQAYEELHAKIVSLVPGESSKQRIAAETRQVLFELLVYVRDSQERIKVLEDAVRYGRKIAGPTSPINRGYADKPAEK